MKEEYDWVTQNFDKVLAEHGYVRKDIITEQKKPMKIRLCFSAILV